MNIYLSGSYTALANTICNHLNLAYVFHFLIGIVNIRSYYILKLNPEEAFGYMASICSTTISFVLVVLIINETRNAPSKAIVTDSVSEWTFDTNGLLTFYEGTYVISRKLGFSLLSVYV